MAQPHEVIQSEAIRERLMEDLAPVALFAEAAGKCERTIYSYIVQGMPAEYIGRTPYVVVSRAIPWLRNRRQRDLEPRRKGRPTV
jgi:hypothetical protein